MNHPYHTTYHVHKLSTISTRRGSRAMPRLRLYGKWLSEWGFPDGCKVSLLFQEQSTHAWLVRPGKEQLAHLGKVLSQRTVQPPSPTRPVSMLQFEGPALLNIGCGFLGGATHVRLQFVQEGFARVEPVLVQTTVKNWWEHQRRQERRAMA